MVSEPHSYHSCVALIKTLWLTKGDSPDNKYKCSSCDRHVDAVKRSVLIKKKKRNNLIRQFTDGASLQGMLERSTR